MQPLTGGKQGKCDPFYRLVAKTLTQALPSLHCPYWTQAWESDHEGNRKGISPVRQRPFRGSFWQDNTVWSPWVSHLLSTASLGTSAVVCMFVSQVTLAARSEILHCI